jgi:L-ascorbate metabolism protein UlaG (beta-lactamase superfamily)
MTLWSVAEHVVIEPLVHSWPAWWCTVAPVPAAFHAARYQIPALRSYLRNPQTHRKAARDPKLAGGTFVDLPADHVPAIQELLARMERCYADACAFAEAVFAFDQRLLSVAKGQALEALYLELPEPLRGLVELVYDYHNRPSMRFEEGLVYASPLHKREEQAVRLWRLGRDAERPFYMSTPNPPHADQLAIAAPFAASAVRALIDLDVEPQPVERVRDLIAELTGHAELATLERYFAPRAPRCAAAWREPAIRIRYIGHACVLAECRGKSVIVDPFVEVHPASGGAPRLSFGDLPRHIDYALVTHAHADHLACETLVRLRPRIGTLVVPRSHGLASGDPSLKRLGWELGFDRVVELDTLERLPLGADGEVIGVPFHGEHGDLAHGKLTYIVRFGDHRMLFAADSTCLDLDVHRRLKRALGPIQTVFMNTETEGAPLSWPFAALFPRQGRDPELEDSRRCRGSNATEGLAMLEALGARRLFNYAMGIEPWLSRVIGPAPGADSMRMAESDFLLAEARARGVDAKRLAGSCELVLDKP